MSTGIVFAMPSEARAALGRRLSRTLPLGSVRAVSEGVITIVCGVGMSRARAAGLRLADAGAARIISIGVSGGLAASLAPGSLVLATSVLTGNTELAADAALSAEISRRLGGMLAAEGRVACVAAPLTSANAKASLHRDSGALAVDMESAGAAQAAAERALPFACLRAVCDDAKRDVPPELADTLDEYGRPRALALALAILRNPSLLARLPGLGRDFSAALRSLGTAYATISPTLANRTN